MSGIIFSLLSFLIIILYIPDIHGMTHNELYIREMPIYRASLFIILSFLGTGVCIAFFRQYKVNYLYIFGIVTMHKLNQYQLYKIFMLLITVWLVAVLCEVLSIKGFISVPGDNSETWPTFILINLMVGMMVNPFDIWYKAFRYELLYSLYQNIIAPFGVVRFKDFFVGDVLTSLVRPLQDIYFTGCFFITDEWQSMSASNKCKPNFKIVLIVSLIPYYIRFWQCINRFYFTKSWFPHLVNAGKYLATIIQIIVHYYKNTYQSYDLLFVLVATFATLYSYAWDITMDWGLLRGKKEGNRLLRDKLKFPRSFYYFSMITNLMLRFSWTLNLIPSSYFPSSFN
jgi:hypothetical protein